MGTNAERERGVMGRQERKGFPSSRHYVRSDFLNFQLNYPPKKLSRATGDEAVSIILW